MPANKNFGFSGSDSVGYKLAYFGIGNVDGDGVLHLPLTDSETVFFMSNVLANITSIDCTPTEPPGSSTGLLIIFQGQEGVEFVAGNNLAFSLTINANIYLLKIQFDGASWQIIV